ncbi:MAG: polyketide cyclase / dehydrase and lipid transport [Methylococcaceae bacterium]|nr:polyketide cyclase / dehydrase and lipid transport [Methylococcaceae bacterium]
MPSFALITDWNIPVPIERCWFSILDTQAWSVWWDYVEKVEELERGDSLGLNNKRRYVWQTCLPYRLVFELQVTEVRPYQLIRFMANGDLQGEGCCRFIPSEKNTIIQFEWKVQTTKAWMNLCPFLVTPIFIWNHSRVMLNGEKSLIKRLSD